MNPYTQNYGESGWSPSPYEILENSPNIESHLSNFLTPDTTSFEGFSAIETSYLPPSIIHDTPKPFQCIDQTWRLHFGDPQPHGLSYDSRCNTVLPIPAPGKLYGSGSAVNDRQSTVDSPCVSSPPQNASAVMQGSHDIADIGATICSLVAEHLKRLSSLRNTQSITTPLAARIDPLSPPDTNASSHVRVDSQGHKPSHRSRKTKKKVNRGTRSRKGRQGDFTCSHPGCTTKALSSRRNLLRHQENVHSTPVVLACGAVQKYRRDNFVRHRRNCQKCQESSS